MSVEPERTFSCQRRVYLGDATMAGRLRLDAVASYLQDIAADDAEDAHLPEGRAWVLRRTALRVERLPTLYEDIGITTWCSGVGGRWAERSTNITGVRGVCVEATAIWVYVSLDSGAPQALPPEFFAAYGDGVRERKVSARLTHPGPPDAAPGCAWPLRPTDFDVLGHVNNAVYWAAVEGVLAELGGGRRVRTAEIEFRGGVDPGEVAELAVHEEGGRVGIWFLVGGNVRASVQVALG